MRRSRRRGRARVPGLDLGLLLASPGPRPSAVGDGAARRSDGRPLGVGVQDPPLPGRRRRLGRRRRPAARRKATPREPSAPHVTGCLGLAWLGWLQHPPEPVGQLAGAGLAAARGGAHALMHPRDALERSRAVIDLLVRDELIAAPRSSLNVPIGATRRIATVHVELQELQDGPFGTRRHGQRCRAVCRDRRAARAAARARRGSAAPGTARDGAGEHPREGDRGELGNKVSSLFVDLPVAEADPLRRYELVRATTEERKAGGQALRRQRGDRADRARAAGAPRGPRAVAVREAAVQRHDHQRPRLAASRCTRSARRWSTSCRSCPLAAEHAVGDRGRLLRRRDDVRVVRRSRRRARPRRTQGRHRHVPARACGAGARASGGTLASGRFADLPFATIDGSVVARCASAPIPDEQHSPHADHGPSPTPQEEPRPWRPPPPSSRQPRLLRRRIARRSSTTSTAR